ncbi:hypothetical protein AVEN_62253-1 [Araneus ventricosus]|uniref:Uncharacterized protein n=1 Tax=Araneus ventricosus TaxID=182803 RepID=A0A4Y2E9R4_ARAVE|nr:hypothetical protein AVEN_62253-1 [Araneus ventricosus]
MVQSRCSRAHCRRSRDDGQQKYTSGTSAVCPISTVSVTVCSKHLRLDLHCIGLSAEPLSGADLVYQGQSRCPFLMKVDEYLASTTGVTIIYPLCEY